MATRGHRDIFAEDMAWQEGESSGIRYARFLLEEGKGASPMVILSRFEPGEVVGAHTHDTNYFEYVIEGEQTVGKVTFSKGDVRLVTAGTGYGPIVVGPQGCKVLIVFQEAARAMTIPKGKDSERKMVQ
ncbi:MAG: cupin domain-containing protein [Novosphingobium sp.]